MPATYAHISDMTPVMARRRMQLAVRKSLGPVPFGSTVGTDILRSMSLSALALNDGAVTVSWSFQAPIAAVWRGLTDPTLLSRWLGTVVEIDIRTGGRLVIDHGQGQLSRSEVIEAEAPVGDARIWGRCAGGK